MNRNYKSDSIYFIRLFKRVIQKCANINPWREMKLFPQVNNKTTQNIRVKSEGKKKFCRSKIELK